eukprot:scaffold3170_cov128-Cylindrotheca_fusiformis.AAC.2
MAAVATMTATLSSDRFVSKSQLVSLLKDCVQHLEQSDEYSPIIYQTSNMLHEYADTQAKVLQTEVLRLKQERDEAIKQNKALQKQQKLHAAKADPAKQHPTPAATAAATAPKLSAFEQQKRAAAEKRRQQVIEQRRKAALEQKRKEEEQKRKFLEKERRKEQLKAEAAKKATQNKGKKSLTQEQRIHEDAISELDKIGSGSNVADKSEEPPEVPTSPSPIQKSSTSTPMSSPPPSAEQHEQAAFPALNVNMPDIGVSRSRHEPPQPAHRQSSTSSSSTSSSSLSSIPTRHQQHQNQQHQNKQHLNQHHNQNQHHQNQNQHHQNQKQHDQNQQHHAPTGTDRKYSTMSHDTSKESKEDLSQSSFESTELKRQILISWALQPPDYQMLKRIDHLVATIQNVYPPFANVPSHSYFEGWEPVNTADFITYGEHGMAELDFASVKKAVRKVRVFLHPDKLPKDFTEAQIFVCKLLWDVTSDALEDFKLAEAARRGA